VLGASDRSSASPELEEKIVDWPSRCHLSSLRRNLVRPLVGSLTGPVLELGAGMGAITRTLGETGLDIVAVEGSPRRAQVCAARCQDLDNVTVVCDTIEGFGQPARFGTVVMIGVLEYSRTFSTTTGDDDPVDLMLAHLQALLAPDGRLVLAIENQLGAKYLAGFPEDHLGRPMVGISDGYGPTTPVTFGRDELSRRLLGAGLPHQQWFYPWPDYKLPEVVISEAGLDPTSGFDPTSLVVGTAYHDRQEPETTTFDLARLYPVLVRNGLLGALANSFLVTAAANPVPQCHDLAWYFGNEAHLLGLRKTLVFSPGPDGPVVTVHTADGATRTEPFVPGQPWSDRLVALTSQPGWDTEAFVRWWGVWCACIAELAGTDELTAETTLPGQLLDAAPHNLVVDGDTVTFIDLEWSDPQPLDFGFLLFRSLLHSLLRLHQVAPPAPGTPLTIGELLQVGARASGVQLTQPMVEAYWERENAFQQVITGAAPDGSPWPVLSESLRIRRPLDNLDAPR
jgi:hypothetical protein